MAIQIDLEDEHAEEKDLEAGLSKDDLDEEVLEEGKIRYLLREDLNNIDDHFTGSFALSGLLPNAANPGLSTQGLGGIGLPHDACRLAASFPRNTLSVALSKVAAGLGIAPGAARVRAELCKLSMSGEGAFLDQWKVPQKDPGRFGTLEFSLPSYHEGGAVEVNFGAEQRLLESAPGSDFIFSYLAWFAGTHRALRTITSGYCLVLEYDLIHQGEGPPPSAARLEEDTQKIEDVLQEQKTTYFKEPSYSPLAYMLEHKYADFNLRFGDLKGKDRVKTRIVQHACQEQGFSIFVANMEQIVTGSCEEAYHHYCSRDYDSSEEDVNHHSIEEEFERSVKLKTVVLPSDSPFEGDPDEEDYDAGDVTHYYQKSCILVMPEESQDELLFESTMGSPAETKYLLDHLLKSLQVIKSETSDQDSNPSLQPCQTCLGKL
ncbi:MAG: hypothetical protein Q9187_004226, partial [Circinaria calcarea]